MSGQCALPMRLLLAAALAGGNVVDAQQNPPPAQTTPPQTTPQELSTPLFRTSVHRVILDVVVTDANDKAVRGLTRDDFTVTEDGKTQRVLSFDVHDFNAVVDVPEVPTLPQNTFMNVPQAPERGPLYVLLVDLVNMQVDYQAAARQQLLKFISDKPHGSRFAIFVLSDGLRLVQGFTSDRRLLYAAMDPKSPRPHVPKIFLYGETYGQGNIRLLQWAFTEVAHFLDALPGRKNLIWLTGPVPTSVLPDSDASTEGLSYGDEIREMVDSMARGQIAVYPVDVRGVVPVAVSTRPQAGPGGGAMVTTSDNPNLPETYLTERDIAGSTGGRAFFSTNDLKNVLSEATETGGNYYTLSYSPSNQNYDGQLRRMHVELSKRGYHLAYRRSYYGSNPDSSPRRGNRPPSDPGQSTAPRDSLFANMQYGAPLTHQLLFKAHLQPVGFPARATQEQMASLVSGQPEYFRERGRGHSGKPMMPIQLQTYAIDYTVVVDRPKEVDARTQPFRMEVAAAAFDGEGVMLNGNVENAAESITVSSGEGMQPAASLPAEPATRRFHRAQQLFDVPVNAKSIRLAVRDVTTDRVGAMEVPLPLGHEPETQADAPMNPDSATSAEMAPPKPN